MTTLIACITASSVSWPIVTKLIESEDWEKVFLVTNDYCKENFKSSKDIEFITVNPNDETSKIVEGIQNGIRSRIRDFEVAINIRYGTGKEHMALISAVLKEGLGLRLIDITKEGVIVV